MTGHWQESSSWGDGNCNQDFSWYDEIDIAVSDASTVLATETRSCDDEGFSIALPEGDTNISVDITVVHHQDSIGYSKLHYDVPGPVHSDVDLGQIAIP